MSFQFTDYCLLDGYAVPLATLKKASPHTLHPTPHTPHPTPHTPHPTPLSLLYNNYSQPEIPWSSTILCAFCQKNFFFAIKLHKKKIIVAGEID